jgi:hypothetical protein
MVKFNTTAGSPDIVYIFLDRIHTCQNTWTAELMKNLSDFVLSNILNKGFNVIQGLDEDLMLREAAKDYTHAVVLSTGTEFINGDEFFHEVEKLVYSHKDFFLMGHIPDRDDGYYELHDQCYIINLKKYKDLNCPVVGEFAYYSEHKQIEPLRSPYNVHDDYTPTWVRWGTHTKTYKHKWHGWNILSVAFNAQESVDVFPEAFRNNKVYYYPNYEPAFIPKSTYLYGKNQVAAQTMFYPHNTEEIIKIDFQGPIRQLITQSSGLNWIDYLITYGYNKDTVVRFVDYNLFALECMKHIVDNWDGSNYARFVQDYIKQRASFLNKDGTEWLAAQGKLYNPNIPEWTLIKETIKFEFRHEDLVLNKALDVSTWVDKLPNTIIHLSHIFNYDPVAPFVPLKHRIYSEKLLLDKLKNHVPDASIIMLGKVSENPQRPTWHMNGDWNGI